MRIDNSTIAMNSTRSFSAVSYKESMTIQEAKSKNVTGGILSISTNGTGKSYLDSMKEYVNLGENEKEKLKQDNPQSSLKEMLERMRENSKLNKNSEISDRYKMKVNMVRKLFEMIQKSRQKCRHSYSKDWKELNENAVLDFQTMGFSGRSVAVNISEKGAAMAGSSVAIGFVGEEMLQGAVWQKVTATSGFKAETEITTFESKGMVQTSDGRSIEFNVEVGMSRAFMEKLDMLEAEDYIFTDPLVINYDTSMAAISDQKFMFDLDADGKEERISFAERGSGFLALDKNGDGVINDGSELFGTKSGDGFRDLAAFDEDGNGWIDENDSVFSKLKVWTKDENGKDMLLDLKQADVGAIFLGSVDTEFSLQNVNHETDAVIRKTGVFLKESTGEVSTINHVDMAM